MSKRPSVSHALALKAAAAAAAQDEGGDEADDATAHDTTASANDGGLEGPRPRGRPRGKRPVAARQTVYLDEARHAALMRLAEDRGRSVHSLIIEGIDHVVGKPTKTAWQ